MDIPHRRRQTGVPLLLALLMTLAGCAGAGSDAVSGAGETASGSGDAPQVLQQDADGSRLEPEGGRAGSAAGDEAGDEAGSRDAAETGQAQPTAIDDGRSIISTGTVSLVGEDVAAARFDVQKIVDGHGGEVAEEKTETDDDGEVDRSRLVVRVPVEEFDATMEELEDVAELESSDRSSTDVTTQVIDTAVRIRAQAESLRRVELLLARAQSIRAIIAIEAQLTRRQADLDSLKSQQAYLADQTSLSTITVFLERKPAKEAGAARATSGFLAGLRSGWDGLETFVTGTLTVLGALLPFAILLLVLGVPLWLGARVVLRRRQPQAAAQE